MRNGGPKCKKGKNKAKLDKVKHGFKRKFIFFAFVRANRLKEKRREEEKKIREEKEEEKRRRRNQGMECLELLYGILGLNCLEHVWNSCLG